MKNLFILFFILLITNTFRCKEDEVTPCCVILDPCLIVPSPGAMELVKGKYSTFNFTLTSKYTTTNPIEVTVNGLNFTIPVVTDKSTSLIIPVFLSEIPLLFKRNILPIDVALIQVSPPDKHGFCSLGTSVDIVRSAIENAKFVIAQVNKYMPRTLGDGIISVSNINLLVEAHDALPEVNYGSEMDDESLAIGKHIASLIEDGSTLQMGIGAIPNAVLTCLTNHKDLGVHTEMFSDGVMPLVASGVINNKYKVKHRGKIVTGFVVGSRKLYDFVDDNPMVAFLDIDYVNDTSVIRKNPKVVAINSAIEVDLTGQVCSDSIGTYQFSGVGGQMDFIRGAALSEGGKPVIALKSTTKNGSSKIVPFLKAGADVVTTRAHVHYVVTEYGIANLFGKNLEQRARALQKIAHPKHHEDLDKEILKRFGC